MTASHRRLVAWSRAVIAIAAMACTIPVFAQETQPASRPFDPAAATAEAVKRADLGFVDEAVRLLENVHTQADSTVARENLARMLMRRAQVRMKAGDLGAAREDLDRGLILAPKEALLRVQLAVILRQTGDNYAARREVATALEADPACASGFEELARINYEDDDLRSAVDALETANRLAPAEAPRNADFLAKIRREAEIEKDFFHDERGNFTVKYDDHAFKDIGTQVLDDLDRAEQKLRATLGHVPKKRVSVILYTHDDFRVATGAHAWTGGLFDGKIRVPAKNFSEVRDAVANTLVHEYTHVVIRDLTSHCPTWLNEGLAQLIEGKIPPRAGELGPKDRIEAIRKLPSNWFAIADATRVRRLYAEGLGFTDFLVKRSGYATVRDLLGKLDGKIAFDAAVESAFGKGLDDLDDDWRRDL